MDKVKKKSTGFYPTPTALVKSLMDSYLEKKKNLPDYIIEPSAGQGDFIIAAWEELINKFSLPKRSVEKMVSNTILFENEPSIFRALQKNIEAWCKSRSISSKPTTYSKNFLLENKKYLSDINGDILVIGNPPWDEFTTRKHDGDDSGSSSRGERLLEKMKFQSIGYKNVYQCFIHEILGLRNKNLDLIFVLPRQLLGDLSSESLRKTLVTTGIVDLTVYCNKDEPQFYFEAVARTAEILCLQYKRASKNTVRIRRGFEETFHAIKPYGADYTLPCPFKNGTEKLLSEILNNTCLSDWDFEMEVTVSRGKVDYTDVNYKKALSGRTMSAYQYDDAKSTQVIVNKILPDSKRKLKAGILDSNDAIADSMLRIKCKNEEAHPYLLLILNSRPVELALRSVISNINLNNFRLMSLPIPKPNARILTKAKLLCQKCAQGKMSWEQASDELAKEIYGLSTKDFAPLQEIFPDRSDDKIAA